MRKRREENNKGITIQPKCLICVDGLDEATSWDFWQERINEVKVYEKDFSGIKFVFLSRPYVFKRYKELKYQDAFFIYRVMAMYQWHKFLINILSIIM